MQIKVEQTQGAVPITIVRLEGEIDAASSVAATERAEEVIEAGATHILLDMSGVPFMSSAGVRFIYHVNNTLAPELPPDQDKVKSQQIREGTYRSPYLKLLNPTSQVLSVMKVVGIDLYLDIFDDEATALGSFTA